MASGNELNVSFLITWKKVLSSKINFFFFFGFLLLLGYIWQKDSFASSFKFFLLLFPYLFLLLSQDMIKDELESGCLENVLFLEGKFKSYLLRKNLFLSFIACLCVFTIFCVFSICGIISGEFSSLYIYQFSIGILVGLYYISLGGLLSFYFKGGSNVLIVILGQLLMFIGMLFYAAQNSRFVEYLDRGVFPDALSQLKLMAFIIVFPNIVISKKFFVYSVEIALLGVLAIGLQKIKTKRLELSQK
ncbi:MAG: hypothetical protein IBX60_06960 [Candidatus Aminicenantes bacterium]|nr:hypothetical protein [Candidatus Aminicenantes bacterium]